MMARYVDRIGIPRKIYALDSFQGFELDELKQECAQGLSDAPLHAFAPILVTPETIFFFVADKALYSRTRIEIIGGRNSSLWALHCRRL